jgi:HK97 family phage major capsid protein
MARQTVEQWLPEEYDSNTIKRIDLASAAESFFRKVPMGSDTKKVARHGGIGVSVIAKGTAYPEDVTPGDNVILDAFKFGTVKRYAVEDIDDSFVDLLSADKEAWGGSYGRLIDNATLGVTAAVTGTTVPFTSVYRALTQTNAATGYTANANLVKTAAGTAVSYDNLSDVIGLVESGGFFDPSRIVIIANPLFRGTIRKIKDSQGNPIFVSSPREGSPDTLFGYPVKWSDGARTSAVATSAPTGNPLLIVANSDFLMLGTRTPVESVVIDGKDGVASLTDETILKTRVRRAFALGHEKAVAILEAVPAV